jgi:2-polyprenyl-6-methoxyphenol hydroxylase-like FAD-dependent oxidoreductase
MVVRVKGLVVKNIRMIVPPSTITGVKTDLCIRGAGVVGQVLALLLARLRIRVTLQAHKPLSSNTTDIRSFALNSASRQMLVDLRVWPHDATPVQHMKVWGDQSGHIAFDAQSQPLAWIVDAAVLQERLSQAIAFASEVTVLSEPTAAIADLTVICEGRASQTRQETGAMFEQFAYEQTAVAAHIVSEKPHENTAWQWMDASQVCALLPRGQSQAGNSAALVWSVSRERAVDIQATSAQEMAAVLHQATRNQLGALQFASQCATWPLVVAQAQQWCGQAPWGAWVLAGDAAHAVHPLAGQGLNLGLGDAAKLASILADKPYFRGYADMKLLRAYERARKAEAAVLRLATDGLQQTFSHSDARLQAVRQWGMRSLDASSPLKEWLMRQASGVR